MVCRKKQKHIYKGKYSVSALARGKFLNLMHFPVLRGADAVKTLESPGKMKLVLKPEHFTYFFNRGSRIFQKRLQPVHFISYKCFNRRLAKNGLIFMGQGTSAHIHISGNFRNIQFAVNMLFKYFKQCPP